MTHKENITAILECYFTGFKKEIIDSACNRILEQESKAGHWIVKRTFPTKLYDEYLNEYECSMCHRGIRCTESQLVNYPYCHCGCRMVESQKSEETDDRG